jgi:hypothetical protein
VSDPTKSCYGCGTEISIYAATCDVCQAVHEPSSRAAQKPKKKSESPVPGSEKPKNLRTWLTQVKMPQYIIAFEENGITLDLLPDLTDDDLKSIGISRLGDRKNLLKAIKAMSQGAASKPATSVKPKLDPSDSWLRQSPNLSSSHRQDAILHSGKDMPKTTGLAALFGGLGTCPDCGATRSNTSKLCGQCQSPTKTIEAAKATGIVFLICLVAALLAWFLTS